MKVDHSCKQAFLELLLLALVVGKVLAYEDDRDGHRQVFQDKGSIHSSQHKESTYPLHHRAKRSVVPSTVLFAFEKTAEWVTKSWARVGDVVKLRLVIALPAGETALRIHLLTHTFDRPFRVWKPAVVFRGSNLAGSIDLSTLNDSFTQIFGIYHQRRRVELDLGILTNSGLDSSARTSSEIHLEYGVLIDRVLPTSQPRVYWITAGAAYTIRSVETVWLGQVAFTWATSNYKSNTPARAELCGPAQLSPGQRLPYYLDITVQDALQSIEIYVNSEGGGTINESQLLQVEMMHLTTVGEAISVDYLENAKIRHKAGVLGMKKSQSTYDVGYVAIDNYWTALLVNPLSRLFTLALSVFAPKLSASTEHILHATVEFNNDITVPVARQVSVLNQAVTIANTNVTFDLSTKVSAVHASGYIAYQLRLITPPSSYQSYSIVIDLSSVDSRNVFRADTVRLLHIGFNYAGLSESDMQTATEVSSARISLGPLSNLGYISTEPSNTLLFELILQAINSTVPADYGLVSATLTYGPDNLQIVKNSNITVHTGPSPNKTIQVSSENKMLTALIWKESASLFWYHLSLPAASTFYNVRVRFSASANYRSAIKFCRAQVIHVGTAVFGVTSEQQFSIVTDSVHEISASPSECDGLLTLGDSPPCSKTAGKVPFCGFQTTNFCKPFEADQNYLVETTLEVVSNVRGEAGRATSGNESVITIAVVVKAHGEMKHQDKHVIYMTMNYGSYTWLSDSVLSFDRAKPRIPEEKNDQRPYIFFTRGAQTEYVPIGSLVLYDLVVHTALWTTLEYSFTAITSSGKLSVVRISPTQYGNSLNCPPDTKLSSLFDRDENRHFEEGRLTLGNLSNTALVPPKDPADNMVSLRAIVYLAYDSSIVNGSIHSLVLTGRTGDQWITTEEFKIVALNESLKGEALDEVSANLTGNSSLVRGGAGNYHVSVYLPPGSVASYMLDMSLEDHDALISITSLRLSSAGINLPTLNDKLLDHKINRSSVCSTNIAPTVNPANVSIDLGVVAVLKAEDSVAGVSGSNTAAFTVVVWAKKNTTLVGSKISLCSRLLLNEADFWSQCLLVTIVSSVPAEQRHSEAIRAVELKPEGSSFTVPGFSTQYLWPGKILSMTWLLNISLLHDLTTNITITLVMPTLGDESLLEIGNIRWTHFGSNIVRCRPEKSITAADLTLSQTIDPGQTDLAVVRAGVVTDTGTSQRNQWQRAVPWQDDVLQLAFDLFAGDHEFMLTTSSVTFEARVEYDNWTALVRNASISLLEGARPLLGIFSSASLTSNATRGDTIQIRITIEHQDGSSRYAYNVTARIRLAQFAVYGGRVKWTLREPHITFYKDNNNLVLFYPRILLRDKVLAEFNVSLDPYETLAPGLGNLHAVFLSDVAYYVLSRGYGTGGVPHNTLGEKYYSPMDIFELPFYVAERYDALGMESGVILDCQLSSAGHYGEFTASKARPSSDSAWRTLPRGPPFYKNEFIQINLGNLTKLTGVTIYPDAEDPENVATSICIQYSLEGIFWDNYYTFCPDDQCPADVLQMEPKTSFQSLEQHAFNQSNTSTVKLTVLKAKYVRILPQSNALNTFQHSLRFELHGYALTNDSSVSDACLSGASTNGADNEGEVMVVPERSYLAPNNNGSLFACVIPSIGSRPVCSVTEDWGTSWRKVPDISGVLSYDSSENHVYAISEDGLNYMLSDNMGLDWVIIPPREYQAALAKVGDTNIDVTELPFTLATNYTREIDGYSGNEMIHGWSVAYDGIYVLNGTNRTRDMVATWGSSRWRVPRAVPG